MEREINTTFKDSKGVVIVKRSSKSTCKNCCYNEGALTFCWDKTILANRGECRSTMRLDNNHIYFERVEKKKIDKVYLITYISIIVLVSLFWYFILKPLF